MKLEFESSDGRRRTIAEVRDLASARRAMIDFLKDHKYNSYYQRYTVVGDEIQVDVGSWTEFFWFTDLSEDDMKEYYKV